jgi:hypothetical protein
VKEWLSIFLRQRRRENILSLEKEKCDRFETPLRWFISILGFQLNAGAKNDFQWVNEVIERENAML